MAPENVFPAKAPVCKHIVVRNQALTLGGSTVISAPFPIGDGYYSMLIDVKCAFTVGTGTTAKAEALLRVIRDIMIRTDRDNVIVKGPARMLYKRAQKLMGSAPVMDTFAASNGTYIVSVPIHFANRRLRRPEDTLLNTARYKMIELTITLGAYSDMLGTPGTASGNWTVDITVEKTYAAVDETNAPIMLPYIMGLPPIDPNSLQYIDIEKNPTLAILDLQMLTTNTDVIAGIPASGTAADTVIDNVTLFDNKLSTIRNVPFYQLQRDNVTKFDLGTAVVAGQAIFDLVEDGSILSGLPTGDKATLQAQWVNGTPTGAQVTVLLDGAKAFPV